MFQNLFINSWVSFICLPKYIYSSKYGVHSLMSMGSVYSEMIYCCNYSKYINEITNKVAEFSRGIVHVKVKTNFLESFRHLTILVVAGTYWSCMGLSYVYGHAHPYQPSSLNDILELIDECVAPSFMMMTIAINVSCSRFHILKSISFTIVCCLNMYELSRYSDQEGDQTNK